MATPAPMASAAGPAPQPCFLSALGGAIPSGILGWFFGVVPAMVRNRSWQKRGLWLEEGASSAKNLMLFSGTYAFAHCLLTRIRQVDDAWNRGIAGCATGLAVGWSGGPASAAQSCVGIGLLSYVLDLGGMTEPMAATACMGASHGSRPCCTISVGTDRSKMVNGRRSRTADTTKQQRAQLKKLLTQRLPPVMWLGAVCNAGQGYMEPVPSWRPALQGVSPHQ